MKQNFKQLTDILVVKFKQLEDTKEATRNLIAYQKFFHPIQTQQMISENLMELAAAQNDEAFIKFQKQAYANANERTRLECKMAAKIFDYDLKSHLEQLEAYHIKGNDFQPLPLKDVQHDFVFDLLHKYLQDVKHRMKAGEFGRATAATLLRKCVKLEDIEYMVEDCQAKSNELLSNADKLAEELAEKRERKKIEKNIKNLNMNRMEFEPARCFKRKTSWKGRSALLFEDFAKDGLEDQIRKLGRAKSRKQNRAIMVRKIPKEYLDIAGVHLQTLQSVGQEDDDEQYMVNENPNKKVSSMALPAQGAPNGQGLDAQAQLQQMMSMLQAGDGSMLNPMMLGQQSQSMDRQEKRKLMNEIKDEMKIMITQISDYQVE